MIIIPKTTVLLNLPVVSDAYRAGADIALGEYLMTVAVRQRRRLLFPFGPPATRRYGGKRGE